MQSNTPRKGTKRDTRLHKSCHIYQRPVLWYISQWLIAICCVERVKMHKLSYKQQCWRVWTERGKKRIELATIMMIWKKKKPNMPKKERTQIKIAVLKWKERNRFGQAIGNLVWRTTSHMEPLTPEVIIQHVCKCEWCSTKWNHISFFFLINTCIASC